MMRRILAVEIPDAGTPHDSVRLDRDQRTRRRMVYTTESGKPILLDMPRPVHLRDGDLLRLEDGGLVRVDAADEALIEITAPSTALLVRIAWHLGNRHLPTQLLRGENGGRLRIRHDHVIADMVAGLGGICLPVLAPFDPEGGAYDERAGSHSHGADHGHHHHGEHAHG